MVNNLEATRTEGSSRQEEEDGQRARTHTRAHTHKHRHPSSESCFMEDDLGRSPSSIKPAPAPPPLLDIDLNAPPPHQDILEDGSHPAQNRNNRGVEEEDDDSEDDEDAGDSEDDEEFLDVDNMSYEELLALGERIGTQSKGLHPDKISALPCYQFVQTSEETDCNLCVICRYDIEDGVSFMTLPCKHFYHSDCIKSWLQIQKNCPICNAEVML